MIPPWLPIVKNNPEILGQLITGQGKCKEMKFKETRRFLFLVNTRVN
jgi:hypothetical protein